MGRPAASRPCGSPYSEEVDWSFRLATPHERVAHRRLSVLPRPFTLDAAEAVCELAPLRPGSALDLVGALAHRSLLASARPSRPGGPPLFGQLDTIRAHARSLLWESARKAPWSTRAPGG